MEAQQLIWNRVRRARPSLSLDRARWHTFQVLTKRHERLAELAPELEWPPNVWIGVSIENKRWVCRADYLRRVREAAVRFISAEPLLGPLIGLDLTGIDWPYSPIHSPIGL